MHRPSLLLAALLSRAGCAAPTPFRCDRAGDRDLLVTHRLPGLRPGYFSVWLNVAR